MKQLWILFIFVLRISAISKYINQNPIKFKKLETDYYNLLKNMLVSNLGNRFYIAAMKTDRQFRSPYDD